MNKSGLFKCFLVFLLFLFVPGEKVDFSSLLCILGCFVVQKKQVFYLEGVWCTPTYRKLWQNGTPYLLMFSSVTLYSLMRLIDLFNTIHKFFFLVRICILGVNLRCPGVKYGYFLHFQHYYICSSEFLKNDRFGVLNRVSQTFGSKSLIITKSLVFNFWLLCLNIFDVVFFNNSKSFGHFFSFLLQEGVYKDVGFSDCCWKNK